MKIKRRIEELKKTIKEEYGVNCDIDINFHISDNKDADFGKANNVINNLIKELGGEKRIMNLDDSFAIGNTFGDGLAQVSFFIKKEKQNAEV